MNQLFSEMQKWPANHLTEKKYCPIFLCYFIDFPSSFFEFFPGAWGTNNFLRKPGANVCMRYLLISDRQLVAGGCPRADRLRSSLIPYKNLCFQIPPLGVIFYSRISIPTRTTRLSFFPAPETATRQESLFSRNLCVSLKTVEHFFVTACGPSCAFKYPRVRDGLCGP